MSEPTQFPAQPYLLLKLVDSEQRLYRLVDAIDAVTPEAAIRQRIAEGDELEIRGEYLLIEDRSYAVHRFSVVPRAEWDVVRQPHPKPVERMAQDER